MRRFKLFLLVFMLGLSVVLLLIPEQTQAEEGRIKIISGRKTFFNNIDTCDCTRGGSQCNCIINAIE